MKSDKSAVIDSFQDMGDRPVIVDVWAGQIRINGGQIRLNAQEDIVRLIAALERARDVARGSR